MKILAVMKILIVIVIAFWIMSSPQDSVETLYSLKSMKDNTEMDFALFYQGIWDAIDIVSFPTVMGYPYEKLKIIDGWNDMFADIPPVMVVIFLDEKGNAVYGEKVGFWEGRFTINDAEYDIGDFWNIHLLKGETRFICKEVDGIKVYEQQ